MNSHSLWLMKGSQWWHSSLFRGLENLLFRVFLFNKDVVNGFKFSNVLERWEYKFQLSEFSRWHKMRCRAEIELPIPIVVGVEETIRPSQWRIFLMEVVKNVFERSFCAFFGFHILLIITKWADTYNIQSLAYDYTILTSGNCYKEMNNLLNNYMETLNETDP